MQEKRAKAIDANFVRIYNSAIENQDKKELSCGQAWQEHTKRVANGKPVPEKLSDVIKHRESERDVAVARKKALEDIYVQRVKAGLTIKW